MVKIVVTFECDVCHKKEEVITNPPVNQEWWLIPIGWYVLGWERSNIHDMRHACSDDCLLTGRALLDKGIIPTYLQGIVPTVILLGYKPEK